MSCRFRTVSVLVQALTAVVTVTVLAAAGETDSEGVKINCQRCTCGQDGSVFSLHCQLTGDEDLVLDEPGPLDLSSRTLYVRLENVSSVHLARGFLDALRRYYSVAVDLWTIGNITFDTDFRPKSRFLFMGVGIVNSSVPELPRGVLSHSGAVGLRLDGSRVGVIRRGAFAQVNKVRYIELTDSQVDVIEGPQIGHLQLSHRRNVHHGSSGLLVHNCSIGTLQAGALSVQTQMEDEFVEIADTTISELGPGGLSVTGVGSVTINHTVFSYLGTGSLDLTARGGISLLNSLVSAAAPAPLWRVRGGNGTRLENITFKQPPSASLVLLDQPTGQETLSGLRFSCRESRLRPGWTAAAAAGRHTVSEGLRRYLLRVEQTAECDPAEDSPVPRMAAATDRGGGRRTGLFANPVQVGLELLILVAAAAGVSLVAAYVVAVRRRRRRRGGTDNQILVEASDASEG